MSQPSMTAPPLPASTRLIANALVTPIANTGGEGGHVLVQCGARKGLAGVDGGEGAGAHAGDVREGGSVVAHAPKLVLAGPLQGRAVQIDARPAALSSPARSAAWVCIHNHTVLHLKTNLNASALKYSRLKVLLNQPSPSPLPQPSRSCTIAARTFSSICGDRGPPRSVRLEIQARCSYHP